MTYLEVVNAVLLRLREQQVATVHENEYSQLIAEIVNEAKREVEDSWNWTHLRSTVDLALTPGTYEYTLSGTNERHKILEAYNATRRWEMSRHNNNHTLNKRFELNPVSGSPTEFDTFAITYSAADRIRVRVWPIPDAAETITFYLVEPQDDLDSTDDATQIYVPAGPVIQGAYLRAINERGEDQGRLSEIQAQIYQNALGTAIQIDANRYPDETTWHPI